MKFRRLSSPGAEEDARASLFDKSGVLTTPAAIPPRNGGGGLVRILGERQPGAAKGTPGFLRTGWPFGWRSPGLRQRGKHSAQTRSVAENSVETRHRVLWPAANGHSRLAPGPQSTLSSPGGEPGEKLSELKASLPTEQAAGATVLARRLAEGEAPTERTPEGTPSGLDTPHVKLWDSWP